MACGLLLASSTASAAAYAQVNVEPLRRDLKKQGVTGRISGSFAGLAGNTEGVNAGGALLAGIHAGRHLAYLDATGEYSRINGVLQVSKSFAHVRENFELRRWLWTEGFAQLENDRFRRIQLRELIGMGPRFGVLQGEELSVFLGTAYMLEHTRLSPNPAVPTALSQTVERWSNYVALSYQVGSRVLMTNTTYYQPRVSDFGDYHLLSVSSLEFKVTTLLRSSVSLSVHYESRVPADVDPTDVEVKNSIGLKF